MTGELGDNSFDSAKRERIESARLREDIAAGVLTDGMASKEKLGRSGDVTLECISDASAGEESGMAGDELIESADGDDAVRAECKCPSPCDGGFATSE